ncbi:MAG: radical SAM protein [Sulfolobales archaeon]
MDSPTVRYKYVFGPVYSRRLGRSLGVNHVPYKTCTYSCVYCQLGRTTSFTTTRRSFYEPSEVVNEVREFISRSGDVIDYVTLVPSGEPLLDKNVGLIIAGIRRFSRKPVAVLTNASLLFLEDARRDLLEADLVSVKVDAARENTWRSVNRPCLSLSLQRVLEGIAEFARVFRGRLVTETMLVDGYNTAIEELELIADFVKTLNPWKAYISIPVRPPAEPYATPPRPEVLVEAYLVFSGKLGESKVELLNSLEPPEYRVHDDPTTWLLNLVSVHPLRLEYALKALKGVVEKPEDLLRRLELGGKIHVVVFEGKEFIVRAYRQVP